MHYNVTLLFFHFIFTNKDLNNHEDKFIKRTIDQFSIELCRRIVAGKLFNTFVIKTSQLIHQCRLCMSLTNPIQCQSSHGYLKISLLIGFSIPTFLSFHIDVIFCFVVKTPVPIETNSFEVMALFRILPFKEKKAH